MVKKKTSLTTNVGAPIVDNNTPVFFLRDPLKFPDLNHTVNRDPRTNMRSAKNNWDFWISQPEALKIAWKAPR